MDCTSPRDSFTFQSVRECFILTDVPNYDRKTDARRVDTILDILRFLSLAQSLLKGRNAPIWREQEPTQMKLSGTNG